MQKKIKFLWLFCFFLFVQLSTAQIKGKVTDEKNIPLKFVAVVLKKTIDSSFVSYTRTDEKGFYSLNSKTEGKFLLSFSSLGFAKQEKQITISNISKLYEFNVKLKEKIEELNEVIIHSKLHIFKEK